MVAVVITFEPIVRRRRLVIACFVALTAATAPGLLRLQIDNSPEGFFPGEHEAMEALESMERDFGRDRGVRLVLRGEGLWTRQGLRWLADLEASIVPPGSGLGGVYAVAGPARHHRWHLPGWPPDPDAFRRLLVSSPVDRNAGWVGPDGEWVTVMVGFHRLSPERRESTLAALEARLPGGAGAASPRAAAPPGISAEIAGLPVVSRALDRGQVRLARSMFPWLVAVAVGLLVLLFRSVDGVLLPMTLVGVTQIVLFGFAGYAGQRIDFVTVLLLPLVFVIMLATAVHVLAYHRRGTAGAITPEEAVERTYRVKAWPVLWTGATTCIGFGSLAASPVPSIRALGLWTAFGVAFGTLAALSLYPALLGALSTRRGGAPGTAAEVWIGRWTSAWVRAGIAGPRRMYLAFGFVAMVAALGLPRLSVDTGTLSYFAPGHPMRQQIERLERSGLAQVSASLVLDAPQGAPGFDDPGTLRRLAALATDLREEPLVWGAVSAGDLVAQVARYGPAQRRAGGPADPGPRPGTAADVSLTLAEARARIAETPDLRELLRSALTGDGRRTRVVVFTPMRSQEELAPTYARLERAARDAFPEARVTLTGQYPLVLLTQRSLLRTVVLSLSLTALAVAGILVLLLRSVSLAARALVPNLWPVLLTLGAMGWARVPLDSSTVMIAAVVLGLTVDDTLHSLGHLRRSLVDLRGGKASKEGVLAAGLGEVAGGHVATSMILSVGFLVPALSELLPVARFGLLSALAIAAALVADLLLVPALLASAPTNELARLAPARARHASRT